MKECLLHFIFQFWVLFNDLMILNHLLVKHFNHVVSWLAFYGLRDYYLLNEGSLIWDIIVVIIQVVASRGDVIDHHLFVLVVQLLIVFVEISKVTSECWIIAFRWFHGLHKGDICTCVLTPETKCRVVCLRPIGHKVVLVVACSRTLYLSHFEGTSQAWRVVEQPDIYCSGVHWDIFVL